MLSRVSESRESSTQIENVPFPWCTLLALFALGVIKGSAARQRLLYAGRQVLPIGGLRAAVGRAIGHVVTKIVG